MYQVVELSLNLIVWEGADLPAFQSLALETMHTAPNRIYSWHVTFRNRLCSTVPSIIILSVNTTLLHSQQNYTPIV